MIQRTIEVRVTAHEMGVEWASASAPAQVDMLVEAARTMESWKHNYRDTQLLSIAEQLREAPIALRLLRDLMAFVDDATAHSSSQESK